MIGAPENDDLTILTDGRELGGWTAVAVDRGVELLPSNFRVDLTERYPGQAGQSPVEPGNACEVFLGRDKIMTGYIDLYWPHEDKDTHVVSIQGRSRTEDLVDCSFEPPPWVFENPSSLKAHAEKVCKPFGIEVTVPDGGDVQFDDTMPPFIIQPGETCAQLLEELSRAAQRLMWDDERGRLVFSKVGTKRAATALVEGVNCEISEARLSMDRRYSVIEVVGQAPNPKPGTDGQLHLNHRASAKDPKVPRHRPKLIVMDADGPNHDWPKKRAEWEVARRYGRSRLVEVTITGWRQGDGSLWQPNTIAHVDLPSLKVTEDLVIAHCSWVRGDKGTQTALTLMPKQGLMPAPFMFQDPVPGYQKGAGAAATTTDQLVAKGAT